MPNTDAYLLMQFSADAAPLRGKPTDTPEFRAEMLRIGSPVVKGLQANGHSLDTSLALMRSAFYLTGD